MFCSYLIKDSFIESGSVEAEGEGGKNIQGPRPQLLKLNIIALKKLVSCCMSSYGSMFVHGVT